LHGGVLAAKRAIRSPASSARQARGAQAARNGTVMNYEHYFENALAALKNERRYRVFVTIEHDVTRFPRAT